MERLTTRSSGPLSVLVRGRAFGPAYFMSEQDYEDYRDALNKLAAYEDTGMEPEEVAYFLGTTMSVKEAKTQYAEHKKRYDEYMAWKHAETEGRLVVLPCKVWDTVYTAQRGVVSELCVDHFEFYNVGIWVGWHLISGIYGNFRMDGFPASEIGKTVFLTRKEAKAKLKERGE